MHVTTQTPDWLALHQRICQGDEDAFNDLARAARPRLRCYLKHRLPYSDDELIEDSISDILLAYHNTPTRFDTSRGTALLSYLCGTVHKRLLHHRRTDHRRRRRMDLVLLNTEDLDSQSPLCLYIGADTERRSERQQRLDKLVVRLTPSERDEVDLMRAGVQEVAAWACLLPLASLPLERQRTTIKFEKVRIKRKLRRLVF